MPKPSRWERAYHEAGHAVAAARFGLLGDGGASVDLDPEGGSGGFVSTRPDAARPGPWPVILMSGIAAQWRYRELHRAARTPDLSRRWIGELLEIGELASEDGRDDAVRALRVLSPPSGEPPAGLSSEEAILRVLNALAEPFIAARELLLAEWPAVEALADALVEHGRLTSEEIERIRLEAL